MYIRKTHEDLDCGIRIALKAFGGKWKLCILDAINRGIVRPVDIHKDISYSTRRVIEMQLAELLFYGLIDKSTEEVYPRKTEYRLTTLGKSVISVLRQIDEWGRNHSDHIKERYAIESGNAVPT